MHQIWTSKPNQACSLLRAIHLFCQQGWSWLVLSRQLLNARFVGHFFFARTGVRDWFRETPQLDKTKVPVDFPQPSDSDTVVKQRRRDCTQCCCNGLRNVYELPETLAHLQPSGQIQAGLEGIFESHKYGWPYKSSHVFRHMGSPKSSRIFQWNHPAGLPPWNRDISARQAKAGPQCLAFNEAALIGYDMNDQDTAGHRKA